MAEETQAATPEAVEATPVNTQPEATSDDAGYKVHPADEKLLAELPEAWHAKIAPHLQEKDKYFQQQLEKFTPYKEFIDSGVSPEVLRGGVNLAKAIETQPMDVYSSLQTYLKQQGLLSEEAAQAARDIMEEETGEDFEDLFDGEQVPAALKKEIEALKAQQQELQEYTYQQQLEKETQNELAKLESDMAELQSKYAITEAHEIAIYDLMNAALNAGRELTVAEAAQQLSSMIGGFKPAGAPASQAEPAPMVIGSAGGAGIQAQQLEVPKNDAEKRAMLAQMFDQYKKANG